MLKFEEFCIECGGLVIIPEGNTSTCPVCGTEVSHK